MSLKLYYDVLSQPSRALLIFLQSCKLPFEHRPVALRKGEHLTEEFKNEVSRFQKVPVLKDGQFILTESIAILRYLAREREVPDQWYPKDSKAQAKVDEYLEWQHNNVRAFCGLYFREKYVMPLITGSPPDPARIAKHEEKMEESLDLFQECFLKSSPYIAGDHVTAADIWAACEIEQPRIGGYNPEDGRPALSKWLNNVRKELSPHYEEAYAILNKLAAKAAK